MSGRLSRGFVNTAGPPPRAVRRAFWAAIAWAALTLLTSISLTFSRPYVHDSLIKANARAKKPTPNYLGSLIDHDTNRVILGGLVTSGLSALILVLLAFMLLRGRSMARWTLLALATVVPLIVPFGIGILIQLIGGFLVTDAPVLYQFLLIAAGVSALAVLVLLLLPESSRYFASTRSPASPRQSLFARLGRPTPPGTVPPGTVPPGTIDVEPNEPSEPSESGATAPARPRTRKGTARRPGSVKPKAATDRAGRSKSRNQ